MAYTGIPSSPFTVPGSAAGFLDVRKKGTAGPVVTVAVPAYTAAASAPIITSFAPTSGAAGSRITITGTNFTGATVVSINSGAVASFDVDSATQISATLTSSQATGKVRVTTPGGTAVSTADFVVQPVSSGGLTFAPQSGSPGNEIALTGSGFTGATEVKLNGVQAFSFAVNSDTSITATVPAGTTTGAWQVTKADGSVVASATNFTFSLPAITPTTLAKTTKTGKINVVCGITSLTFGAQVAEQYPGNASNGGSAYSWPGRLKVALEAIYGVGNVTVRNRAINGQTLQQAMAAASGSLASNGSIDAWYDATPGAQNWFICEVMANELFVDGQNNTAAAALDLLDTFIDGRRNAGFQIGLLTDTPRQHNTEFQTKMTATNAAIRGSRFAGKRLFVGDVGATQLGDAGGGINAVDNTRWYLPAPDLCHGTIETYKLRADMTLSSMLPWLNPVQVQGGGDGYVEDPDEATVPFTKPQLYVVDSNTAQLIADNADGSRGQAISTTVNFANAIRSLYGFAPVSTQWIGEFKSIVQDLLGTVVGLGGKNATYWEQLNYAVYYTTDGSGQIKMAGKPATLESGTLDLTGITASTAFKLKLTKSRAFVYRDGALIATMVRTESSTLYAYACMHENQSTAAFQIRAQLLAA